MINSIFPVIHHPTRVTVNSATLIDNVFTNNIESICSGIIFADISDHFPIYCVQNDVIDNELKLWLLSVICVKIIFNDLLNV